MAAAARFREGLFRVCPRGLGGGGTMTATIEGGAFTGAIGSIGHEESEPVFTHTIGSKRKKHRSSLQVTGKADPATAEGRSHPHRRLIVDRDIGDAEGAPLLEAVAVSSPRHHAQQVASSVLRQRKGKVAVAAPVIEGDMDVVADTGRRERAPVERYDLAVLENRCTHVTFAERRVDEVRVEFEFRTHGAGEQLLFIAPMEQPGAKAWDNRFRQRSRGNRSTIDAIQVKPRHLVQAPDQLVPDRGDQAPTLAIAQIARLIVALEFQHHLSRMLPDTQPLFNPPTGGCVSWLRHKADAPAARRSQQRRDAYLGGVLVRRANENASSGAAAWRGRRAAALAPLDDEQPTHTTIRNGVDGAGPLVGAALLKPAFAKHESFGRFYCGAEATCPIASPENWRSGRHPYH